jgi:hypothetical protein
MTGKQGYSKECRRPVCKVGCTVRHRNSSALGLITLQSIESKVSVFYHNKYFIEV